MLQTSTPIPIAWDDAGSGEPALLLMPGWCSPRTVYRDLAPRLARHRRVMTLDWRGHGESGRTFGDFGEEELVEDAEAVIEASGAEQVVPVALSDAGWIALELRRRLGARISKLVLLEWLVLGAPPPFQTVLTKMQSPQEWRAAVRELFAQWLQGVQNPALERYVNDEMGAFGFEMWARAARAIEAAYAREESPLQVLSHMVAPLPVLHLYAQPDSFGFLTAQEAFAIEHPWFHVRRLEARSHFPMFEVPDVIAAAVEEFAGAPQHQLGAPKRKAS